MTNTEIKKIILNTIGASHKIANQVYSNGDNIYFIKFSKIHQIRNNYWYTVDEENLNILKVNKVTNIILAGPIGYYNLPIQIFNNFISSYPEVPKDGRYHFDILLESHRLYSNKENNVDVIEFLNKLPFHSNLKKEVQKKITMNSNFFSFKTNTHSITDKSPDGIKEFIFDRISWHFEKTKVGDIVFYAQHGDRTPWVSGLSAICQVIKAPFEKGYESNYYKLLLKPLFILPKIVSKEDLIGYFNCYNIIFIGPMTKGEPNQANNLMTKIQAKHLVGALIDIFPENEQNLVDIFGEDFPIITNKATNDILKKEKKIYTSLINIPENPVHNQPKNLILYGAPGTGKSYEIKRRMIKYFNHSSLFKRITFHSNYSYRDFVGSYKPIPLYKESDKVIYKADLVTKHEHNKEPIIEYTFVPGVFLLMLEKAVKNPNLNFVIAIEEINRANTASVFGDVFQLLDRNDLGESEYSITFESSANNYLKSIDLPEEIKIPKNLYLWATMNNSDQGVLPLDTAFKRRWSFEHVGINQNENVLNGVHIDLPFLLNDNALEWNTFRKKINNKLLDLGINEDKLIGPFFLNKDEISNSRIVKNKLLLYLKEDVLRYKTGLFKKELNTFSKISEEFDKNQNVFDDSINWIE